MKYFGVGLLAFMGSAIILTVIHVQVGFPPGVAGLLNILCTTVAVWLYRRRENSKPPQVITPAKSARNIQRREHDATSNSRISASPVGYHPQSSSAISSICPACSKDNPRDAIHCMGCGKMLPTVFCPICKAENPPQAVFCMSCGERR